ncbi:hypothetical protein JL722_7044 [Aureococcus anophagefferens]|nr:hypothetical protein JL722_7044 [Aureococcus anophagefferens]
MTAAPAPSTTPIQDSLLSCFCYDENIGRDSPSFERTEVSSSNVSDFVVSVHVEDSAPTPAPQVSPPAALRRRHDARPAASLASRDFPAPRRAVFEPSAAELAKQSESEGVGRARRRGDGRRRDAQEPVMRADSVVVNLEAVKAELRGAAGVPVLKHCRDGRIRPRALVLSGAGDKLGWKAGQKEATMLALKDVKEVRFATELDPTTIGASEKRAGGMAGTETLRKSALGPEVGKQAFSLILPDRTLDVQCATPNEARRPRRSRSPSPRTQRGPSPGAT